MTGALYAVVSGSLAAMERLDIASNNLANVNTAGFKAQMLRIRSMDPDGLPTSDGFGTVTQTANGTVPTIAYETVTDFSQGAIRDTGNPLDVALSGPGFFAVSTPAGERYARQGQFHVDATGTLVTANGYRVQSANRQDIRLPAGAIEIDAAGEVRVDDAQVATLRMVRFDDAERVLDPIGRGVFAAAPEAKPRPIDATETTLVPRGIELSNVSVVEGLLELVDVSRGYEAYMRAMQQVDGTVETAIREVGGPA